MFNASKIGYRGDLRWLGSLKVIGNVTRMIEHVRLLFTFRMNYMSWSCTISKICELFVESHIFSCPKRIWRSRWGDPIGISSRFLVLEN